MKGDSMAREEDIMIFTKETVELFTTKHKLK
jgi:hypothetical protein